MCGDLKKNIPNFILLWLLFTENILMQRSALFFKNKLCENSQREGWEIPFLILGTEVKNVYLCLALSFILYFNFLFFYSFYGAFLFFSFFFILLDLISITFIYHFLLSLLYSINILIHWIFPFMYCFKPTYSIRMSYTFIMVIRTRLNIYQFNLEVF